MDQLMLLTVVLMALASFMFIGTTCYFGWRMSKRGYEEGAYGMIFWMGVVGLTLLWGAYTLLLEVI